MDRLWPAREGHLIVCVEVSFARQQAAVVPHSHHRVQHRQVALGVGYGESLEVVRAQGCVRRSSQQQLAERQHIRTAYCGVRCRYEKAPLLRDEKAEHLECGLQPHVPRQRC